MPKIKLYRNIGLIFSKNVIHVELILRLLTKIMPQTELKPRSSNGQWLTLIKNFMDMNK